MRTKTLLTTALFAKEGEAFAPVALPHTWNALDGQDGGGDYWRGIGPIRSICPTPRPARSSILNSGAPTMWLPFTATAAIWVPIRAASPLSGMI